MEIGQGKNALFLSSRSFSLGNFHTFGKGRSQARLPFFYGNGIGINMTIIKNLLSVFLLLVGMTCVSGQTSVSTIDGDEVWVEEALKKTTSNVSTINGCEIGKEEALKIISSGKIYFPMLVESSLTLRKLLEIEYGILDKGYSRGTCLRSEGEDECFSEAMLIEIEKKRGKIFLSLQQAVADELDKEGQGYVEPRENGVQDLLDRYIKTHAGGREVQVGYSIILKISPDKRMIDFEVLGGELFAKAPILRNSSDYVFLKEAFSNIQINCEPARLRGKPVESLIYLHAYF